LDISYGITPWVDTVEPEWRDYAYPEAGDELEGIPWNVVVSSENLIGSKGGNVVVRVPLNLEKDC